MSNRANRAANNNLQRERIRFSPRRECAYKRVALIADQSERWEFIPANPEIPHLDLGNNMVRRRKLAEFKAVVAREYPKKPARAPLKITKAKDALQRRRPHLRYCQREELVGSIYELNTDRLLPGGKTIK